MSEAREDEPRVARSASEALGTSTHNEQRRNETVLVDREFEDFLKQRYPRLLRIALRATRNLADAEDLVQEVCIKAYKARQTLDGDEHALCWLVHVMLNLWRDLLRKRRRFVNYAQDSQDLGGPQVAPGQEPAELLCSIFEFVETFERATATIWYLSEVEGESNPAIAAALKIQLGTVARRLARARQAVDEYVHAAPLRAAPATAPPGTTPPTSGPQRRGERPGEVGKLAEQVDAEPSLKKRSQGDHD